MSATPPVTTTAHTIRLNMPNQKLSQGTTVKTGVKRCREASKSPQRDLQNRKKTSISIFSMVRFSFLVLIFFSFLFIFGFILIRGGGYF